MSEMGDTCLRYGCIKCCLDTEMPLSSSDIARIRNLGFSEDFFIAKENRNPQLKNASGRCVFHDGQRCVIYNHRPEGCQLYPAVLNEEIAVVVLDSYCPHHAQFQLTPNTAHKVTGLVRKLDAKGSVRSFAGIIEGRAGFTRTKPVRRSLTTGSYLRESSKSA